MAEVELHFIVLRLDWRQLAFVVSLRTRRLEEKFLSIDMILLLLVETPDRLVELQHRLPGLGANIILGDRVQLANAVHFGLNLATLELGLLPEVRVVTHGQGQDFSVFTLRVLAR